MTPQPRITMPCLVTEVVDGDTMTVELRIPMRVRLINCWAPEARKEGGSESKENLALLAEGRHGVVSVPLGEATRLDHVFTFGRVLGDVWIDGDDESVGQQQVSLGHAAIRKP